VHTNYALPGPLSALLLIPIVTFAGVAASSPHATGSTSEAESATAGSPPDVHNGSLSLSVGGEVTELEVTHCRTDAYEAGAQPGMLRVLAEVTAVGTFRGRPAALFMAKSVDAQFENIDLYLTELSPELQVMPPLEAYNRMMADHREIWNQRSAEIQADYPLEELEDLPMEEMMAKMNEMSERIVANDEEMGALLPYARVFGAITVDGSTIRFAGNHQISINPSEAGVLFSGVDGDVAVTADCGS